MHFVNLIFNYFKMFNSSGQSSTCQPAKPAERGRISRPASGTARGATWGPLGVLPPAGRSGAAGRPAPHLAAAALGTRTSRW